MSRLTPLKALTLWCAILVCAILNGGFREAVLIPHLGLRDGTLLSGVILSAAILTITYLAMPWLKLRASKDPWIVGALWLVLTLILEFGMGRYLRGESWQQLLAAYTFKDGNLWPVILLITLLSPRLAARMRKRR